MEGKQCDKSETTINGKSTCKGKKILYDEFKTTISTSDWITEQYVPNQGPVSSNNPLT